MNTNQINKCLRFCKNNTTQFIHLKQGGIGKAKIKEDGSYHMNFVLSTSIAKRIFINKLNDYLKKYENANNSYLRS